MNFVPDKFWKIFPLVVNGVFIVSGITIIITSSLQMKRTGDKTDLFGFTEIGAFASGVIGISLGVLELLMGIFGVTAFLLNRRLLYSIYGGLIICVLVGNLFTFFGVLMTFGDNMRETMAGLRQSVRQLYGTNTQNEGRQFTKLVDDMQRERGCCGLSGDETHNIFLETNWHRTINFNATGKLRNLPDSCCTSHKPDCFSATDLAAARTAGHVHEEDCVKSLQHITLFYLTIVFLEVTLSSLGHLVIGAFLVFFFKFGPAPAAEGRD